jgi:phosphoribosyl 1,2-cyclic phosphodiesterase
VLEANHDIQRLWRGPYHPSLKRRVAGPKGHLANTEAARLVSELAQDGRPRNIWLAHLSAANNTPDIALETVTEPLNQQGCTHLAVAVLARDVPSRIWSAAAVA